MSATVSGSEGFLAAYEAAVTPAQLYRCRIEMTGSAAPQEVLEVLDASHRLPRPERRWLSELAGQLTAEVSEVRVFERTVLHEHARLYRDVSSDASSPRTLLIAFGGKAHRLMLHLPVFLQHLPVEPYDVAFLTDPKRDAYRAGIPGIADDLPGLLEWVLRTVGPQGARVQTLGASMGGGPALIAASLLSAERGVCVGGGLDEETAAWAQRQAGAVARRLGTGSGGARTELLAVHAGDNVRDTREAANLVALLPGVTRFEVHPASQHSVLEEAREHGALASLLRALLSETSSGALPADGSPVRYELGSGPAAGPSGLRGTRRVRRRPSFVVRRALETGLSLLLGVLPVRRSAHDRIGSIAYRRFGLLVRPRRMRRRLGGAVRPWR